MVQQEGNYKRIPVADRIKRIREQILHATPTVCSERALLVTKAYKETEGRPIEIRRALAFKSVLENMTINIWDDELIVGNLAAGRRAAPIFPEWGVYWLEEQLDSIPTRKQDKMEISDKVKEDLRGIFDYWHGRTVYDRVWGTMPEEVQKARKAYIFTIDLYERGAFGHLVYDTPTVLRIGFAGLKAQAHAAIENADFSQPKEMNQVIFWQAIEIICDGVIIFAHRYAAEARRLAELCEDAERKAELNMLASVCDRVPEHGATSFQEAIQAAFFVQLLIQIEGNGNSVSLGRLDQYFIPYFRNDIETGAITYAQGQELLDCFWLKLNEIIKCWDTEAAYVHAGFPMTQNVVIGGQLEEGVDATNELTYMFLTTQDHIRLSSPQFTMRVFDGTPRELLLRAAEIIKGGGGMPALFGDDAVIRSLENAGIPRDVAVNYCLVGCVEPSVVGAFGRNNGGYINIARIVDCALNDGVDRLTGQQIGVKTGRNFETFEDFKAAVERQMAYFVRLQATENHIIDTVQAEVTPHLFASSVIPDCIKKGKDITRGGARYHWTTPFAAGLATAADSLAAIRNIVFENKRLTLEELNRVLDSNFEGIEGERTRLILLSAPKYGNDEPAADEMARYISEMFFSEVEKYPTARGGHMVGGVFTLSATVPHGWKTGATANGRKASTPISDSISPTNSIDKNGPTAVLQSASRLNHGRCSGGNVLNIKFAPTALEASGTLDKFSDMLKTYLVDLKGMEVQVNVVSAKMMRAAQKEPDQYKDLIVRMAGYSVRFVELSEEIQNDIITRTEHQQL